MADYSDLMKLEKKPKQSPPPVPTPLPTSPSPQQEEAGKPANLQTDKQVNLQASLHANPQASKPASRQTAQTEHPPLEKFSTYMRGDYKKRLKQVALDKDCDTYEVLQEAIAWYFQTLDTKK
jgi:hypothetical protein